jgi:hypothetical protein
MSLHAEFDDQRLIYLAIRRLVTLILSSRTSKQALIFLRTYEYFGKYRSVNTAAILGRLHTHDGEVGLTQTRYDFRQKLTARFL